MLAYLTMYKIVSWQILYEKVPYMDPAILGDKLQRDLVQKWQQKWN